MQKIFAEVGLGNDSFFSTEFEEGDTEYRAPKFVKPPIVVGYYFRSWVFRREIIISSDSGVVFRKRNRNKFKILVGISGTDPRLTP